MEDQESVSSARHPGAPIERNFWESEMVMKAAVAGEGMKAAPPLFVTTWVWLNGLTLDKWVALATLTYIVLQAAYLVWKWIREARHD